MLFNSYIFIFAFLPITFVIYYYLKYKGLDTSSKIFLVFSSLFFYSWWNIIYLPLILISMIFNYYIGIFLQKESLINYKSRILFFGIAVNLSLLGYFKYADFFIENINTIFDSSVGMLNLALPLAISFFTFQQIAYLVDSSRGQTYEYNFLNYSLFITFFPQLIAGPIVHHKEMMPQFSKNKNIDFNNIATGLIIFSIGLFKKVIIADSFSVWATTGFDVVQTLNTIEAWVTSLSYTFQIYFDFSGYTDMAIGVALLFNIKLPINFNSPYKATNIQDFWQRWHITLSRFLKEYIYIPLGGNRRGEISTYANLMTTFILGGIWHGAGWTFIFWGFLHGLGMVIHRIWSKLFFKLWDWVGWIVTFNFINISWVFFRAKEWDDAMKVLKGMFSLDIALPQSLLSKLGFLQQYGIEFGTTLMNMKIHRDTILWIIISFIIILFFRNSTEYSRKNLTIISAFFISTILLFSIYSLGKKSEFLYFNF